MKLTDDQYYVLKETYIRNFPIDIPDQLIYDYRSIIDYKNLIAHSLPDIRILNKLLDIIIEKITKKLRFQKLTLLKLIKHHSQFQKLETETIDKMFFVFKSLIIDSKEELAWKLTVLLKERELSEEQICWLIDYYDKSSHIQNRLLRYPALNKKISDWAYRCLNNGELNNRISELIALQLNFNKKFKHKNKVAFVWGIHFSQLNENEKKNLLLRATSKVNFLEVLKICEKNSYTDIISFFFDHFSSLRNGQ